MIDWTKPVRTVKRKLPVEIISTNGRGAYPIVGYAGSGDSLDNWTKDGTFDLSETTVWDLENAPEKKAGYINIYPKEYISDKIYESRSCADSSSCFDRIACIRIEYEDGQSDD